jgi:hypothetical protein
MAMKRAPLNTARLVRLFLTQPFSSLKTILAIHWEALRLWIKGAVYHKRNPPPARLLWRIPYPDPRAPDLAPRGINCKLGVTRKCVTDGAANDRLRRRPAGAG